MIIRRAVEADAQAIAEVHVDTWRSTYRGIVPDVYLDRLSYGDRAAMWKRTLEQGKPIYVAQTGEGDIVGFANGGAEREGHPLYKGELYALYIRKAYHGQGIGKRLVAAVMEELKLGGYTAMLIWVLEDNPAVRFYAKLGGHEVAQKEIEIGGARLQEIAFGYELDTVLTNLG